MVKSYSNIKNTQLIPMFESVPVLRLFTEYRTESDVVFNVNWGGE